MGTRRSPRPHLGERFFANLGRIAPRDLNACLEIVIACDKREAFAQGSKATKQSSFFLVASRSWIASLRSQ
jgi:hypothetical protein